MHTYDASASECITSKPPLLNSRKPYHRKLHSRNSPYYKRRQLSYQLRRAKRIRESDYPELSSSDEYDPPPPLTQSGLPNPHFLPYMPRPSDIVPAIEDGSASDAGFDTHARQVHKRRVEAMRILLSSIGPRGTIIPVPHWKRSRAGLSKYTTYMNPPKEDNNLPDLRVPLPLLSRFYRGSLLAVHRVGRPTKRRNKESDTSASPEASAFEHEYLGSSSRSDFEVTQPTAFAKAEPEVVVHDDAPASPVKNAQKDLEFSKAAFMEELDRIAAGSSSGVSDDEMEAIRQSGVIKRTTDAESESEQEEEVEVPANYEGQKEPSAPTPEKKSEIDLFREMLSSNPEMLFEEKPIDNEPCVVKGADVVEEGEIIDEEDDNDSNLTEFQKDQRIAMMFSHNTEKRPRSTAKDLAATYLIPSKRRRHNGTFGGVDVPPTNRAPGKHVGAIAGGGVSTSNGQMGDRLNLKFAMKVMNKMGFTGRLGKKEDGRKDPVLATRRSFRSGLGTQQVQNPAQKRDQSLLPTNFKGKLVGNGGPVGSSDASDAPNASGTTGGDEIHTNGVLASKPSGDSADSGDVFTRRRKRSASAPLRESEGQDSVRSGSRSTASTGAVEKKRTRLLDDADTYETDEEDNGVDNGRRAILVDIDALIKDSAKRRLNAIEKVLNDASLRLNVNRLLAGESRDLCEAELLRKVLGHANVKPHNMEGFTDKLDEAFESLPPPETDVDLLDTLRQYSKDAHFGIFHRGSRRRLQYDLKATGLSNSFLQEVCATVKHEEKWPYVETWQDLMCRIGVRPRQCVYILNETRAVKCKGDWRPSMGVATAASLGAQAVVWEKVEDGAKLYIRKPMKKEQVMKINNSTAYNDRKKGFDELLKNRMPVLKRRRVLAQYEDDLLWYSAVVQFEGSKDGKCWIKFNKFENTEWVCSDDLVPLCRRDYRKMKAMDFPGLIDSDASVL